MTWDFLCIAHVSFFLYSVCNVCNVSLLVAVSWMKRSFRHHPFLGSRFECMVELADYRLKLSICIIVSIVSILLSI